MIVKPSVAKYKYNLDSENETTRQLATSGGLELIAVVLSSGLFSSALRIHDSANGAGPSKDSILITANAGESTTFTPARPAPLTRGLYIVMEQGAPSAEAFLLYG